MFAEYWAIKYQQGNVNLCFVFLFSKESRFINTLQILVRLELHKYIYNVIYFLIKKNQFQSRNLVLMSSLRLQGGAAVSTVSSQQDSCGFNPEARGPRVMSLHVLFRFVIRSPSRQIQSKSTERLFKKNPIIVLSLAMQDTIQICLRKWFGCSDT